MAIRDNLEAYWSCEESSGDMIDAEGANDLALLFDDAGTATGKVSNGRDFEANNFDSHEIADNSSLSTGDIDFSCSIWIKFESIVTGAFQVNEIIGKWRGSSKEWVLQYDGDGGNFQFVVYSGASFGTVTASNFGAASTGTWYNIVCGHDSVNNQLFITVNDGTPNTQAWSNGVQNGTNPFTIGYFGDHALDAIVDEISFSKKVYSSAEITWIYNSGSGRSYADWVAGMGGGTTDGVGAASFAFASSGVGLSTAASAGSAAVAFTGTAAGASTVAAAGAAPFVFTGTGVGRSTSASVGAASVTFNGLGVAFGANGIVRSMLAFWMGGALNATPTSASASFAFSGSGVGRATAAAAANASFAFAGSGVGRSTSASVGAASFTFTGTGSSASVSSGSASFAFTGTGIGSSVSSAVGSASFVFGATSANVDPFSVEIELGVCTDKAISLTVCDAKDLELSVTTERVFILKMV